MWWRIFGVVCVVDLDCTGGPGFSDLTARRQPGPASSAFLAISGVIIVFVFFLAVRRFVKHVLDPPVMHKFNSVKGICWKEKKIIPTVDRNESTSIS